MVGFEIIGKIYAKRKQFICKVIETVNSFRHFLVILILCAQMNFDGVRLYRHISHHLYEVHQVVYLVGLTNEWVCQGYLFGITQVVAKEVLVCHATLVFPYRNSLAD